MKQQTIKFLSYRKILSSKNRNPGSFAPLSHRCLEAIWKRCTSSGCNKRGVEMMLRNRSVLTAHLSYYDRDLTDPLLYLKIKKGSGGLSMFPICVSF